MKHVRPGAVVVAAVDMAAVAVDTAAAVVDTAVAAVEAATAVAVAEAVATVVAGNVVVGNQHLISQKAPGESWALFCFAVVAVPRTIFFFRYDLR